MIYYFFLDYVQELKNKLFAVKSKLELKPVAEKYNAKVPPSLSSQFSERVSKPEAVKKYTERQKQEATKLYPSGKIADEFVTN